MRGCPIRLLQTLFVEVVYSAEGQIVVVVAAVLDGDPLPYPDLNHPDMRTRIPVSQMG